MSFDIVIPLGPNDTHLIQTQLCFTKKNIIDYHHIYIITSFTNLLIDNENVTIINENIFPFHLHDIEIIHGKSHRNGWYLQQLIKLYAPFVIKNMLSTYLVIDADTFFLKPTSFIENGKYLYNVGTEYHLPYFEHMKTLDDCFTRSSNDSGICHHMLFDKNIIQEIFHLVEEKYNKPFWFIFLKNVNHPHILGSGASEYELYFHYIHKYHTDKIHIRRLSWINTNSFEPHSDNIHDYISYHWYIRQ